MSRTKIAESISHAAQSCGYHFYSGFDYRMNETIIAYPAMWLSPIKIVAVNGCREGRIKYRISLQIMNLCPRSTPQQKEVIWDGLECSALDVYRLVATDEQVVAATVIECAPGEFSLTNHGELSMGMKFDLEVPFCNL